MSSVVPAKKNIAAPPQPDEIQRRKIFGDSYAQVTTRRFKLASIINHALTDLMLQYPQIILFGEDVAGKKGGVYGITKDLTQRFGINRVFNAMLDKTSIIAHAISCAQQGLIPVIEIEYQAYIHNAIDQLRGEAATASFFSNGGHPAPMVIRIAGLGCHGFGGHFHNENAIAALREIPGIIIACPSNGADAARMLRKCLELARQEQRIVIFLEPIALYPVQDLHTQNDKQWLCEYPAPEQNCTIDEVSVTGESDELCIISYGNGYYRSRQAAKILKEQYNINAKVIDIRWLKPLPIAAIAEQVQSCQHALIVDECRKTGSPSEEIITLLHDQAIDLSNIKRITAEDSFIPLGPAAQYIFPGVEDIVQTACEYNSSPVIARNNPTLSLRGMK